MYIDKIYFYQIRLFNTFDRLVNQISVQTDEIAPDQVDSHYQPSTLSLPLFPPTSPSFSLHFYLLLLHFFFCKDFLLLYNHNTKEKHNFHANSNPRFSLPYSNSSTLACSEGRWLLIWFSECEQRTKVGYSTLCIKLTQIE